ncbi:ABC transporter permease [Amycolatopsis acidiphila]|uniref:ABC transporter permease n=1 Tax=Amycolatopsis acidiphila TaxID=715473 RepID=A0A558AN23_9PSEU|nr:ABC transporter permease [Amycolatopsis acidiphila]TVT25663.1 ABC transporter permease [Amycolatopsis acidiphila]UIJ60420.1 ABC transporter permease [Amycolatopsis acidiphila]GHG90272.1 peptide ABC transporter permease [Amycolatopsis acidiphila]
MISLAGVARLRPRSIGRKAGSASLRAGTALLATMVGVSLLGRILLVDPNSQDLSQGNLPPLSAGHLLGTDVLGRDILSWCARGVTTSLGIGVVVAGLGALLGVLVGASAGYAGGWVDALLMRVVDLNLAVPPMLVFLAAMMLLPRGIVTMVILLAAVGWVPYARLVRAEVLVHRERGYIAAARLAGTRRTGIIFGHLVPASATPIVVLASLHTGFVMLAEGGLSFLGLGLEPPTVSLGYLISQGRDQLATAWWIATFPGVFMVLLILAVNLIGDGMRDRFHVDDGSAL